MRNIVKLCKFGVLCRRKNTKGPLFFPNVSKEHLLLSYQLLMISYQMPLEQVLSGQEFSEALENEEMELPSGLSFSGQEFPEL